MRSGATFNSEESYSTFKEAVTTVLDDNTGMTYNMIYAGQILFLLRIITDVHCYILVLNLIIYYGYYIGMFICLHFPAVCVRMFLLFQRGPLCVC